jgi:hypothetical protein
MHRIRGRLTYSNVMVTVLAVLVLGSGTAYAASHLGKETVGARQLKKGAVTPAKLSKATTAALVGAKGATGPQGAQGSQGVQGPSGAVRAFRTSNPIRPAAHLATSLFSTEVLSLAVPPGRYSVTANLGLEAVTTANTAACRLINGHGGVESKGPDAEQALPGNSPMNLTMSDLFVVRSGQELNVECSRDAEGGVEVRDVNIVAVEVQQTFGTFEN